MDSKNWFTRLQNSYYGDDSLIVEEWEYDKVVFWNKKEKLHYATVGNGLLYLIQTVTDLTTGETLFFLKVVELIEVPQSLFIRYISYSDTGILRLF